MVVVIAMFRRMRRGNTLSQQEQDGDQDRKKAYEWQAQHGVLPNHITGRDQASLRSQ